MMARMSQEDVARRLRGQVSRRRLLIGVGAVAATAAGAAGVVAAQGHGYPRVRVAPLATIGSGTTTAFDYPLPGQSSLLLDLGEKVPGGIGPRSSIVAFSLLCQHMGCPVSWVADESRFVCPCHQSAYDPSRAGTVIQGVAQRGMPRVGLEVDGDDVVAVGVEGLIYGFRDNLSAGDASA